MVKMLVTQALDERDLLRKRIHDAIERADLVATRKASDSKVCGKNTSVEEFEKESKASLQSITDLINRYEAIDAAILLSNAMTEIEVAGKKMTRAAAINLRKTIRNSLVSSRSDNTDFRGSLIRKLSRELEEANMDIANSRSVADRQRDSMTQALTSSDKKELTNEALDNISHYCENLVHILVDPIQAERKLDEMTNEREELEKNLETAIKVSNATTYIEI